MSAARSTGKSEYHNRGATKVALCNMNDPNRNWHRRWTVDLSTCTATHENGLTVRFAAHPDAQRLSVLPDHLASQRLLDEGSQVWERASGKHVANYVTKCTNGVKAGPGAWKITVPEPKDDLERLALDMFLKEFESTTGVKPTIETWQ